MTSDKIEKVLDLTQRQIKEEQLTQCSSRRPMTASERMSTTLAIKKLQQDVARSVDRKRNKDLSWSESIKQCNTPQI